jgi:hypothetical protein
VPPAPVSGQTNVVAEAGDVFLYNTALWHCRGINSSTTPRYAILSGWCRGWLLRPTKPPPHPDVLARAGPEGAPTDSRSARPSPSGRMLPPNPFAMLRGARVSPATATGRLQVGRSSGWTSCRGFSSTHASGAHRQSRRSCCEVVVGTRGRHGRCCGAKRRQGCDCTARQSITWGRSEERCTFRGGAPESYFTIVNATLHL